MAEHPPTLFGIESDRHAYDSTLSSKTESQTVLLSHHIKKIRLFLPSGNKTLLKKSPKNHPIHKPPKIIELLKILKKRLNNIKQKK